MKRRDFLTGAGASGLLAASPLPVFSVSGADDWLMFNDWSSPDEIVSSDRITFHTGGVGWLTAGLAVEDHRQVIAEVWRAFDIQYACARWPFRVDDDLLVLKAYAGARGFPFNSEATTLFRKIVDFGVVISRPACEVVCILDHPDSRAAALSVAEFSHILGCRTTLLLSRERSPHELTEEEQSFIGHLPCATEDIRFIPFEALLSD